MKVYTFIYMYIHIYVRITLWPNKITTFRARQALPRGPEATI
jgi:hypothetical protein